MIYSLHMITPKTLNTPSVEWIDLSPYRGCIRVSGNKAGAFLQGQLSNDVLKLTDSSACFAAHLNLKGRILQLYAVFKQGEDYLLSLPLDCLEQGLSDLQHYARFSRVTLSIEPKLPLYGLASLANIQVNTIPKLAFLNNPESPGYVLDWEGQLKHPLSHHQAITIEAWQVSCLSQGIPDITLQTREQFLPHYLGLKRISALSFTKGCYTGQEIVARMEYLSKNQAYHLVFISSSTDSEINQLESIPGLKVVLKQSLSEKLYWLLQVPSKSLEALALFPDYCLF